LLLQQLRGRLFRNSAATLLHGPLVRLLTIIACSALVWAGVYIGSLYGFSFIKWKDIPFAGGIVGTLFDMLFFTLGLMLIFSTSIILYSSLFSAAETTFLLTTPIRADQVFAYKYQGAVGFSSWAFILLGSPILIAYGWVFDVPWYFYALLPLFFTGFVLLPGSIGAILSLLLVNYLPRQRKQVLILTMLLLAALGLFWLYRVSVLAREAMSTTDANSDALQMLLGQFTFVQDSLLPSHWMTRGLEAAARGDLLGAIYPLALVWSNGLVFYLLAATLSVRLYRRGYNRVATGGTLRRRYGGRWLDGLLSALVSFLHPQTRHLIVKDFRTFRRDPAQWAQIVLFMGLLAFYLLNTRRFYQEDIGRLYRNAVSLINLAATASLLCAYTGRFIYPMLSLEGRKFWILGLLPLQRERLLWGKFAFSATGALIMAETLVMFSDALLAIDAPVIGVHALVVLVLAVGLSGLSVGLGACLPNFRETDPSKVAVGFGGTLNLVIGLMFLLLVICLMAAPVHVYASIMWDTGPGERLQAWFGSGERIVWWIVIGVIAGPLLGVLATVIPLRMGIRAMRRMEF
jgi:ABC-2 type transport system permease protein